jgi:hypothetical protein
MPEASNLDSKPIKLISSNSLGTVNLYCNASGAVLKTNVPGCPARSYTLTETDMHRARHFSIIGVT